MTRPESASASSSGCSAPYGFCGDRSDGPVEVSVAPERIAPQLPPHPIPQPMPYNVGRRSLEPLRHVRHGVLPAPAHEQVHVVRPELAGFHAYAEPFARRPEALSAERPDLFIQEDIPPVLGRELQVVVGLPEGRAYASQQLHLFHPTPCGHRGSELSGPAPC